MTGHEVHYEVYYSSGTSRDSRTPPVLLPGNVPLDDRGLEHDLVFAGYLSNYINFYNTRNEPVGTWFPFFGKSEPVLLASIATADTDTIDKDFNEHSLLFSITKRIPKKKEELEHLFLRTLSIALQINHWHKHLSRDTNNSVMREIDSQIEGRLRLAWSKLRYLDDIFADPALFNRNLAEDYSMFGEKWQLKSDTPYSPELAIDVNDPDVLETLQRLIRNIYNDFFHALIHIIQYTRENLETIIREKHDNRPDLALYIAFTRMMKSLRAQMNTITQRHIDFYYFDVLRHKRLPFTPDHTFVRFKLQENADVFLLEKGTELIAGKDETGKELVYTTDNDIFINKATIASTFTLFVSRNPEVKTGAENGPEIIKSIFSSTDPTTTANGTPLDWWPLVGCDQLDLAATQRIMREATLGFSIASPALFLSEGQRDVTVVFSLDDSEASTGTLRNIISTVMKNQARNQAGAVFYLFSKAFRISITSPDGWQHIDRYGFAYDEKNAELTLRFSFLQTDAPVTAYNADIHGTGYSSKWPVLRLVLNTDDAPVYAYSLLSNVLLNRIRILVDVKGMRKLNLYSNAGKLSTDKPFQPFGATPLPGSYLLVGNSEALNKNIKSLALKLSWHDLPAEGFAEFYKGYPGDITNASFTAGISLLQDSYFLPVRDDQQRVQLFEDANTDHPERGIPVRQETDIDAIDLSKLRQRASWKTPEPQQNFTADTQDGFIRVELLTPPIGFGSMEYAPLLSAAIIKNSKKKNPDPLPYLPYIPVLNSISLDYSAEMDSQNTTMTEDGELPVAIFRHHPFGTERLSIASNFRQVALFPKFDGEGYLFIGISGLELPQPLSLLLMLSDESLFSHESPGEIKWSYLSNNTWKTFRDDRVIADGTKSFVQPGIVELDLPADMTNDNTIMPGNLHWICASVKEKTHCVSYAKTIHTQAVSVTWKNQGNSFSHLSNPLPAGSITKTKLKLPAIKEVVQPLPSTDGLMPEEKEEAYTRLSERLGHRNRAFLPVDYERLVLQHFPTVYKAQCFPDMNSEGKHRRGNVLVVVIPDIDRRKDINIYRPKDSYSLLQSITEFLRERASPFATIEVRNPWYERVKVVAKVKFRKGLDSGYYLRKLNQDMKEFLSPWIYDSKVEVRFGGFVSRSDVLGFVERRPYVDFVTGLSVIATKDYNDFFQLDDTARQTDGEESDVINAGRPWSILVTATRHLFTAISEEEMALPEPRGINNLVLGDDFIITG